MDSTATIKVLGEACRAPGTGGEIRHPWQRVVSGSGLMLHAPLDLTVELSALRADFAALDGSLGHERRSCLTTDGSWSSITLVERSAKFGPGTPTPLFERMPSVARLAAGTGWAMVNCHLMRLPPRAILPWHFESQAPHLPESRLLVPLHAPAGAVTLIGDEAAAYPEGVAWTGDFNFPHQVENRSDEQRIMLIVDVMTGPELLRMLPPAIVAETARRSALAMQAVNELIAWRQVAA